MTPREEERAAESCKTCRYFILQEAQHVYGDCHRQPPQFGFYANFKEEGYDGKRYRIDIQRERGGVWPNVSEDEWCGEYQPLNQDAGR